MTFFALKLSFSIQSINRVDCLGLSVTSLADFLNTEVFVLFKLIPKGVTFSITNIILILYYCRIWPTGRIQRNNFLLQSFENGTSNTPTFRLLSPFLYLILFQSDKIAILDQEQG